ncbi:hypothetical protein [Marinobacter arenosus]|uniref:hypothetical protein n=1 Tax=Marinobacter arenosus TaxID=2856822 RepID=UPI001C4CDBEF|nr:hypothetical protein [Marinobacter arenosus]MBW0147105.1 hypothetical protein [Marinobacter arenosus]
MDQLKPVSKGAQHYILLVIPRLLREIEELGLPHIIRTSGFSEREVTSLYFEFVSIKRVLPAEPKRIAPEIWQHLTYCVQVMSAMVNAASVEQLAEAREQAIQKFLPHARQAVESEYREQCSEGTVDFRLAGILKQDTSPEQSRDLCMEAIRLEREQRLESIKGLSVAALGEHSRQIVEAAMAFVQRAASDPPEDFGLLDLVIRLLDLLRLVLALEHDEASKANIPQDFSVDNIVLGIGNALYRNELGLQYSSVKVPHP